MITACKIKWQTTRGKEESGWKTSTALGQLGRERETKIKIEFTQKDFFQRYGLYGWSFCSRLKQTILLLDLSILFLH
jgi:hypothetical protein